MEVAVIGAGIVGASVAFRLARGGADVTLIDRSRPARGTTSATFAWVNANRKTPRAYHDLNLSGMREHFRLREEFGEALWLHTTGNLMWAGDERDRRNLEHEVERLRSWDYTVEWLQASEVNESFEPGVNFPHDDTLVAHFPGEAWADAPRLTDELIRQAVRHGAATRFDCPVESLEFGDGVKSLRLENGESVTADGVVNAAGPSADAVAAMLGRRLPLAPTSGLLVRLAVEGAPIGRILHAPGVNLRPDGEGRVLAHHESIDRRLREGEDRETLAGELAARAREVVPALADAKISRVTVGVRAIPEDGFPCVGAVPGLPGYYEAVTHSGVTLGPLVGRLLAAEVMFGGRDPLLDPFRPERFGGG